MGEFIKIEIDQEKCIGIAECGECTKICPVNVFEKADQYPVVIEVYEDECTLCSLCTGSCKPDAILINKLYE